jgi:hypothetical protein
LEVRGFGFEGFEDRSAEFESTGFLFLRQRGGDLA